jgi:hypothetical protein
MSIEIETPATHARADTAAARDRVTFDRLARQIEHRALQRVSPADIMPSSLPNPWLDGPFRES